MKPLIPLLVTCLLLPATATMRAAEPAAPAAPAADGKPAHKFLGAPASETASLAYRLLDICQEAAANDVDAFGARPTVLSRQMAIWATSVYDAWAAYDSKAVGTRLGKSLRQPKRRPRSRTKRRPSRTPVIRLYFSFIQTLKRSWKGQ